MKMPVNQVCYFLVSFYGVPIGSSQMLVTSCLSSVPVWGGAMPLFLSANQVSLPRMPLQGRKEAEQHHKEIPVQ